MLGDIFGLSAGLTSVELELFLFLLRASFESPFLPKGNPGLVGDATALREGLGFPDKAALAEGVLRGPSFGVFRDDNLGVDWPSS
jgi:hypothetical protein